MTEANTANIAFTKVVPLATTVSPYYDDYNENKNYFKVLFRPGYAVQARELTQLQTMLQAQIERFGNHVFKNGSIVLGGQLTVDRKAQYINLQSQYNSTDIDLESFKKKFVTYGSGNVKVRAYVTSTGTNQDSQKTIVLKYLTGQEFEDGTVIKTEDGTFANVATSNSTGTATTVGIEDGIFFINGYFVKVPKQQIVVDKYSSNANCKVGLEYSEEIVTEQDDSTLLDPAQESSNYQAPGASRLKVNFDLVARPLDTEDEENFIEMLRIDNGFVTRQIVYPVYSVLGDTFARRTFDESGNYTVRRFDITLADNTLDSNVIQVSIGPGKAYVDGYEIESIAPVNFNLNKARDTEAANDRDTTAIFGNYIYVNNIQGAFNSYSMQNVALYSSATVAGATTGNKIGTARVRELKHTLVTNVNNANTSTYQLSLFDVKLTNSAASLAHTNTIISTTGSALVDSTLGKVSGATTFRDVEYNTLIYPLPDTYIKAGTMENQDYQYQRSISTSFSVGYTTVVTLSADETFVGQGTLSGTSSTAFENFMAFSSSGSRINLSSVVISSTNPQTATITSNGYSGAATVYYRAYTQPDIAPRTKIRVNANTTHFIGTTSDGTIAGANSISTAVYSTDGQVVITNPYPNPGRKMSLYVPDVIRIAKIYSLEGGTATAGASLEGCLDVTGRYILDNGQRDDFYDHADISLAPAQAAPTGPLVVCFDYYSHAETERGFFSVDSYPDSSGDGYASIPSYTSTRGVTYTLRDCVDFRPTKKIASTGEDYAIISNKIPYSGTSFEADYEYYLGRRASLVVTKNGDIPFGIYYGNSSKYPQEPLEINNSMVLYKFIMEPYTATKANVRVQFVENRRYTMRDIGSLEQRISNLEYYQTLSILEKKTSDLRILDANGLERTKLGILAENFCEHGEVTNPDYFIGIDPVYCGIRPAQTVKSVKLFVNENANTVSSASKTTLNYTELPFIFQNAATEFISVTPFQHSQWIGNLVLFPENDFWVDTIQAPDLIVDLQEKTSSLVYANTLANMVDGEDLTVSEGIRANNSLCTESNWWCVWYGSDD